MDIHAFLNLLLSSQSPVLPNPMAMRLALHLVWAVVLGSGTLLLAARLPRRYRLGWAALVMAWTLLPGSVSPAYWLGLAFQIPSWTSALICLIWLWRNGRASQAAPAAASDMAFPLCASLAGIVLGWLLLLDTLAWWPLSIYAWGFSSIAVEAVALLALLYWLFAGGKRSTPTTSVGLIIIAAVLALFVVTRLPSGNLWDALLDPWLWIGLQALWLVRAVRWLARVLRAMRARRASAATRA